jgi:hypothetical protein
MSNEHLNNSDVPSPSAIEDVLLLGKPISLHARKIQIVWREAEIKLLLTEKKKLVRNRVIIYL